MRQLFSPINLRDISFENRIVVSPMCQYMAKDGLMDDWHLVNLGQYAFGAAGLLFTEATHISAEGRISPACVGLWNEEQKNAMQRVVEFCQNYGKAKIGIQIGHAGRKGATHPPFHGVKPLKTEEGAWEVVAPSPLAFAPEWQRPREASPADLKKIKEDFIHSTKLAIETGAQIIDLHVGHGYLLNQFFSPLSNQRTDDYGGSLEKRMRFPLEIFEAVRAVWPSHLPLGVRVSAIDWVEGGTSIEDTICFAQELQGLGCDFMDITTGGVDARQKITVEPGYQVQYASKIKHATEMPIMAVGLIHDPHQAEAIIAEGHADFVMSARGMMADPRWSWHAAQALEADIDYPLHYERCKPVNMGHAFPKTAKK